MVKVRIQRDLCRGVGLCVRAALDVSHVDELGSNADVALLFGRFEYGASTRKHASAAVETTQ